MIDYADTYIFWVGVILLNFSCSNIYTCCWPHKWLTSGCLHGYKLIIMSHTKPLYNAPINPLFSRWVTYACKPLPPIHQQPWLKWIINSLDARLDDWPLTSSPVPTFVMLGLYLLFVLIGPQVMKHRKPLDLKIPMMIYNLFMVILSYYMFHEVRMQILLVIITWIRSKC